MKGIYHLVLAEEDKQKKAAEILNRLLNAAVKAQKEGKYIALHKLVSEANKVTNRLARNIEMNPNLRDSLYIPVQGIIVE